jgi:hypothetical protein
MADQYHDRIGWGCKFSKSDRCAKVRRCEGRSGFVLTRSVLTQFWRQRRIAAMSDQT